MMETSTVEGTVQSRCCLAREQAIELDYDCISLSILCSGFDLQARTAASSGIPRRNTKRQVSSYDPNR